MVSMIINMEVGKMPSKWMMWILRMIGIIVMMKIIKIIDEDFDD